MTDPDPDSMPLAAAAIKRTAAKKTAVKKSAATAAAKSPAKSPAKKATATTKKAATKKAAPAPKAVLPPPPPPEPAPAAKKATRKKAAPAPEAVLPLPPPPAPPEPAAPAPRKKAAARKAAAKAAPAPEADLFTLKEAPAAFHYAPEPTPPPTAEPTPPTRTRRKTTTSSAPAPEPAPQAPPPPAPEPTPAPLPAAHSPSPQDASQPSQQQPQHPDSDGPDSQNRRLSKFERWKQRKEKFKLIKQQRYLERQAQLPSSPTSDAPTDAPRPHPLDPLNRLDRGGDRNDRSDRNDRHDRGRHDRRGDRGRSNDRRGPDRGDRSPDRDRERFDRDGDRTPRPDPNLGPPEPVSGLLEMTPGKGFGFLRDRARGFQPLSSDAFVSPDLVRQLGLRDGVWIDGSLRRGSRGPQITEITAVNGRSPDVYRTLPLFEELTAINPSKRYLLETVSNRHTTRIIDFIAPIGRGQRGLIVAPPRAGKTTILQHIAEAIQENYEDTKLIILLVDERPEEVTEIARALPSAEVMASNNDRDPREHLRVAQLAIERARRLVEAGEHVFMLLDSITRLARAFNNAIRGHGGGKGSLSGGVDARALEGARRLFAAARNTREAGSLTIVATALVETNSRADELIFQEFKGTGNMELVLDRRIAQQYIYPAVDIFKSGTRREELLLPPHQMEKVHLIRRGLAGHKPVEAAERLIHFMNKFPSNAQMLIEIKSRE
jgi:transcription termination factor Rho